MFTFKYHDDYKAIRQAQSEVRQGESGPFDLEQLEAGVWWKKLLGFALQKSLPLVFRISRRIWPIIRLGRVVAVSRAADVSYVLKHPETFEVVYGLEMIELAGGENFVLGMDGSGHDEQAEIIRQVMTGDDARRIAATSRELALILIKSSGGRIDVMKDLITRVASETATRYFGLRIDDADSFAEWTLSISALLFADPSGNPTTRRLALAGAARVRGVIDRSIATVRSDPRQPQDTLVARLLALRNDKGESLDDATITAILVGLATGLVPTNTLAAGKILQELLRRPKALAAATDAARRAEAVEAQGVSPANNRHKDELQQILFEVARLNPALAPGQWRYAREDGVIVSADGRMTPIARGTVLMAATASALRDHAAIDRPNAFDPKRQPSGIDMMFGEGIHACLGRHLAMAQITEIFQVLLAQENLRVAKDRWGRMRWTGPFPTRLDMEFELGTRAATQDMLTICAPLKPDSPKETVTQLIADLEKAGELAQSLEDTGIVHFASLSVIEAGDDKEPKPWLLLELNVDGTRESAIRSVTACAHRQLGPVFDHTPLGGSALADTLSSYALELKTRPWGATGLNFNGTPEFPVADIEMQQRLAKFTREALTYFIRSRFGIGNRALPALKFIRGLIHHHPSEVAEAEDPENPDRDKVAALLLEGPQFKDHLILPGRKRLLISEWTERTNEDAIYHFLKSWDFWRPMLPLLVIAALLSVGLYAMTETWLSWPGRILVGLAGGLAAAGLLAFVVVASFVLLLRYHERTDLPDDREPTLSDIRTAAARENLEGRAQNHFMAVTVLKPGWFRKLTLALSLWGIKQLIRHSYRPGFVLNMGTIHYAKWFRLPKTDKIIFLSNYDGSWESYLEDFIMKAHAGQTAAWSNGVGFPKTRLLIYEGAQDGDRFKRWVRRQQVPAQFWYTRFPDLTTDQIRNNAVIHQGLARAWTDTAAMSWLDCFGSMQRPDHAIETDEIQSLMFRGFKRSPYAAYALIKLPDAADVRAAWLDALLPGRVRQDGLRDNDVVDLKTQQSRKAQAAEAEKRAIRLDRTKLTFGDRPFRAREEVRRLATFVAFSARGLAKLGLRTGDGGDGLVNFASAFNIGMSNRARILGDKHDETSKWRWSDAPRAEEAGNGSGGVPTVDAVLIVFDKSKDDCTKAIDEHRAILGAGAFIEVIDCAPVDKDVDDANYVFKEHFGFRDGISQPVIRGTHRPLEGVLDRDIVEPGEFILGYRNNQGYYPPAISVSATTDFNDRLPDVIAESPPQFPSFRTVYNGSRDFGRNGTYLVLRKIEQHKAEFEQFTLRKAQELNGISERAPAVVGGPITDKWVAAKMMGRWQNGVPLALRPENDGGEDFRMSDLKANDFAYARDDPQGLRCPFGAHIRRANPRDGLRPGDGLQQAITNRHRLLRRGRTYEVADARGKPAEQGIVFTCLCADLERQFEFVQQTWIGSSSFHGLTGEVDPMIGSPEKKAVFTIPTPSGPITLDGLQSFVTVRAGGYFFMPSYSALLYLRDRNNGAAGLPSL